MAYQGMDDGAVEAAARQMLTLSNQLDGISQGVGTQLEHAAGVWQGPDSHQFRADWQQSHAPSLRAATAAVHALASKVLANVSAQRTTSDTLSGGSGAGSGSGPISSGGGLGLGNVRWPQIMKNEPGAQDVALAQMAGNAEGHNHNPVAGWDQASTSQLAAMGLTEKDLHNPVTGLDAQIYTDGDGHYVLAFGGTDFTNQTPQDGLETDLPQGMGALPPQYLQGIGLAQKLQVATDGNVVITGHSLGGGVANLAGRITGAPTVGFDSAGLAVNNRLLGDVVGTANGVTDPNIRNYDATGEIMHSINVVTGASTYGKTTYVTTDGWSAPPDPASVLGAPVPGAPLFGWALGESSKHHDISYLTKALQEQYGVK